MLRECSATLGLDETRLVMSDFERGRVHVMSIFKQKLVHWTAFVACIAAAWMVDQTKFCNASACLVTRDPAMHWLPSPIIGLAVDG